MAIQLRKKAPFFCRAKSVDGKTLIHLDGVLTDTDGDLCPLHTKEATDRQKRFFNAPIAPANPPEESRFLTGEEWEARKRKGPIWPGAEDRVEGIL